MTRTLFLPAAAILVAVSMPAQAQVGPGIPPIFQCQMNAVPIFVRAEGLAERVSDLLVTCTGNLNVPPTATFTVQLRNPPALYVQPDQQTNGQSANITSRVLAPVSGGSEALMLVDDLASPAVLGSNLIQGVMAGPYLRFQDVPIVPPAPGTTRTFRITNLRVDARDFPDQTIVGFVSAGNMPIINPGVVVAVKAPGASFALQTASDTPAFGLTFQQAGGANATLAGSPTAAGGSVNYHLKFTEGFSQSFRKRNAGTTVANPTGLADQNTPGIDYHTESGFYSSALPSTNGLISAGLASQGTRLVAQFQNVPAGASLYVTVNPLPHTGGSAAVLVATDASGTGAFRSISATTLADAGGTPVGIAPVSLTAGSGAAAWEILDADPNALESYTFGLVVVYTTPLAGTAEVTGGLGPLSAVVTADAGSPVPRFADNSADTAGCASSPCLTVSPRAIALSYQTGTAALPPITIQVGSSTGAVLPFNVSAASSPDGWISITSANPVTPGSLNLTINSAFLASGMFQGTVLLTSPTQAFAPVSIPVILTVTVGPLGYRPLECTANMPVPPEIRVEGLAERVGDFLLICTGSSPGFVVTTNVDLELTDPAGPTFTSRIVNPPAGTEAMLLDELSFLQDANPIQGVLISPRLLRFPNVQIVAPGNGPPPEFGSHVKRIVDVRIDATSLNIPGTMASSMAFVKVSLSGVTVFTGDRVFPTPILTAAFAQSGLSFSLATPAGTPAPAITFQQPSGDNTPLADSPNATGGVVDFHLTFAENFLTAFRTRNDPYLSLTGNSAQNLPGAIYNSESGFFDPTFPSSNGLNVAGMATQGTRLMAHFTNIPAGVSLYATVKPVSVTPASAPPLPPAMAQLVATDASGAGAFSPVAATTTAIDPAGSIVGIAPLTVTGGTATAVWEVTANYPASLQQFTFGVVTAYQSPQLVSGSATVNGSYAPLSTVKSADAGVPVPRFVELPPLLPASLSITKTHIGNFIRGQKGVHYTITVSNAASGGPANVFGTLLVFEAPPAGLTLVSMSGADWDCSGIPLCFRTDVLDPGMSYPPITAILDVANNAPAVVVNRATLFAGNSSQEADDPTAILQQPFPDLTITSTHTGNFTQGQAGAVYTIVASNIGLGSTNGPVTVSDTLPAGLTAVSMNGAGWNCTQPSGPCTRSDVLAAGTSYAVITLTVNVANNAPATVTNTAFVSGGDEANTSNDTAGDVTRILSNQQVDLALNHPATQSSTLPGAPSAVASSAVDGNTDGSFYDGSVTATNLDTNAWWQVDLGASATVNTVVIANRTDCCNSRLSDYWVFVSNTPFLPTDTPATLQGRAGTFASHQITAPAPSAVIPVGISGRYVRVQLSGANYLSLAEVQVFGTGGAGILDLAVGKAATQSSTYPNATAGPISAVDGSTDGNFFDGSVTATNPDPNAWWQVDLGASASVSSVVIWNRTDCCASRLSDYWVFVSNTPFLPTDTPATLQGRAGTFASHQTTAPSPYVAIPVSTSGRYVRVQLSGTNYLSLAEVQVFGQ